MRPTVSLWPRARGSVVWWMAIALTACTADEGENNEAAHCIDDNECSSGRCEPSTGRCDDDGIGWPDASLYFRPDGGVIAGGNCEMEGEVRCQVPPFEDAVADPQLEQVVLACQGGSFEAVAACPDSEPCFNVRGYRSIACGRDVPPAHHAVLGLPCLSDREAACSFSGDTVRWCVDGRWADAIRCGNQRCVSKLSDAGVVVSACENNVHSVGDRCDFPSGQVVCAPDGAAMVTCDAGAVVQFQACEAGTLCGMIELEDRRGLGCVDAPE